MSAEGLVILLHGFGSNGADLLGVAEFWRDALPRVATVGPNAPERAGLGFQWFSLAGISEANRPARIAAARPTFDALIGGGVDSGSSTLIIGPAGTGKSLIVFQFIKAAIARGEKVAMFAFDEEIGLLLARTKAMNIDLEAMQKSGDLIIEQIDAAEVSPGEFAHKVRACVVDKKVRTVVIDSLNGYQNAMPQEQYLILHMHELLQYLNRSDVATFVTVAQHGLVGDMQSPVDVTYLADSVILLRFFEAMGEVRRAVSVVKKRTGPHENTIREFTIGSNGLTIGEPLHAFQGVLRGAPTHVGSSAALQDKP